MNNMTVKKFVCCSAAHAKKAMDLFGRLKPDAAGTAVLKKALKNRKWLSRKTIEEFKANCSVGDVLLLSCDDKLCFPLEVFGRRTNGNVVVGTYRATGHSEYDYSWIDGDFMRLVKCIYPNGVPEDMIA